MTETSRNDRETQSVVLLKLLNTISVAPSNIQRAVITNASPFKFDVHYFGGGGLSRVVTTDSYLSVSTLLF